MAPLWQRLIRATIIGLLYAVTQPGCSHLTVAPKPVAAHSIAFDENKQNAGVIDCGADGCLVTSGWIEKYHQLESTFKNTIAADKNIKRVGDQYKISYEVLTHFLDLKRSERGAMRIWKTQSVS